MTPAQLEQAIANSLRFHQRYAERARVVMRTLRRLNGVIQKRGQRDGEPACEVEIEMLALLSGIVAYWLARSPRDHVERVSVLSQAVIMELARGELGTTTDAKAKDIDRSMRDFVALRTLLLFGPAAGGRG
jgi:hypothetical protein